jgi:hypothetical protein
MRRISRSVRNGMTVVFLAVIALVAIAGQAFAAEETNDPVGTAAMLNLGMGARAIGMGGAHIAVADDATAIYYNPAGLGIIRDRSVTSLYARLHGAANYLALGYGQKNVGVGLFGLGASGIEETDEYGNAIGTFDVRNAVFAAGYGREVLPGLSLGGALKVYSESVPGNSGKGVTGDVGVLYSMNDGKLRLGAVGRNLAGSVRYESESSDKFERSFGVGAAYLPMDNLLIAVDAVFEDGFAGCAGVEYRRGKIALRAGGNYGAGGSSLTAGAGFAVESFTIDYAYQSHSVLPDSHRLSLGVRF